MEINKAIRIWKNVIPEDHLEKLQKFCDTNTTFEEASTIGDNPKDEKGIKLRETLNCALSKTSPSLTNIRWRGYFQGLIFEKANEYTKDFKYGVPLSKINDIEILKYEKKGRYVFHNDDCPSNPRTLSVIFLVNDNYEGGELVFSDPMNGTEAAVPKEKNSLIIWPSNFLYPHAVRPVNNGTRFSIVGWIR